MRRMTAIPVGPRCSLMRPSSLPDDQSSVQAAITADDQHGSQLAEVGEPRLGGAGLHDPVQTAKDAGRPDPLSSCRWAAEPVLSQILVTAQVGVFD